VHEIIREAIGSLSRPVASLLSSSFLFPHLFYSRIFFIPASFRLQSKLLASAVGFINDVPHYLMGALA